MINKNNITTLTSKYQTTIPQSIRKIMNLEKGDLIQFKIENDRIYIQKVERDIDYLTSIESTLDEWNSPEDEKAYREL